MTFQQQQLPGNLMESSRSAFDINFPRYRALSNEHSHGTSGGYYLSAASVLLTEFSFFLLLRFMTILSALILAALSIVAQRRDD